MAEPSTFKTFFRMFKIFLVPDLYKPQVLVLMSGILFLNKDSDTKFKELIFFINKMIIKE